MNEKAPRRVGSFSAGVFLILFGIGVLLCMFLPQPMPALSFLSRFSPVLLILLGGELLFTHFRAKTTPVRVDGFSIFLCIAVALFGLAVSFASLGARAASSAWQNQRYDAKLQTEAETLASNTLNG
ncbi:MAG: hypothetical protein Q4G07_05985, partial [Oscillospiraceae bacterium]|nr:hypothetical protein [Oscillospiraceae bacterium]